MSTYDDRALAVGDRLRALRRQRGLSQSEVAKRATEAGHPMHQTAVTKIEKHQRRAGVDDVFALADVFGVDPGELLGLKPSPALAATHLETVLPAAQGVLARAALALEELEDAFLGRQARA